MMALHPEERSPVEAFHTQVSRRFPAFVTRLIRLRHYVWMMLETHPCRDDAVLVACELATNAVCHTRSGLNLGAYQLVIRIGSDAIRLEVHDDGGPPTEPDVTKPNDDGHGYGLQLVEGLAARWGHTGDATHGRRVWAELTPEDPPPVPPAAHPNPAE